MKDVDSNSPEAKDTGSRDAPEKLRETPNDDNQDAEKQLKSVPYPKSVFFIVSNEFCERFTFYGMRTVLSLYLKNQLDFPDTTSTVIYHVFIMICYFFPLLGAIVADSWLGKYKTILYLSMVYALGNVIVSVSAVPGVPAVALTMIGLVLIALGTGGIKPCVAAFGGDQFVLPQQEDHLKKFFSIFYFTINAGSFVSTLLTPILRETQCFGQDSCYSLAFGVPALLMIIAIVIYFLGTRFYSIKHPEGNVVVSVGKCIWYALSKREKTDGHWLDKARDKYDQVFINDIKAALRVLVLYIPLPFFWALFDQQGSRWTFQASRMSGEIGSVKIQPDQMQVVNPVLILAFIPLFETVLYPLLARCNLLTRPLQRLTVGGLLAAVAFLASAAVEFKLEPTYAVLPKENEGQVRLYNGLPENITVNFLDPKYESESIASLGFWKKYDVPASPGGASKLEVEFTFESKKRTETLEVYEKNVTSYIFMRKGLVQIKGDDADKSKKGHPKIMVMYAELTQDKTVAIVNCDKTTEFSLTQATPYSPFKELSTCDSYTLVADGRVILDKMELKQGGVYVAFIREEKDSLKANLLNIIAPNSVHMLWLVPQFVIITAGEVMFSITGLEFSFTQAPVSMKSVLQAAWLLTVAAGNLIVVIIAEARVFERQLFEFLLFAGLMAADMLIFSVMAMRYKYVNISEEQNEADEKAGN